MAHRLAAAVAVLLFVTAASPALAVDYTVGGSQGWTSGVDYKAWASDKTFVVGDNLVFQYSFIHTVDEVGKSDYSACSSANSVQSYTDQNTKVALTKPGTRYFICGTSGHCAKGMKLAVTVKPAAAGAPASPSPSPDTSSSTAPPSSVPATDTPSDAVPSTTTTTSPRAKTPSTTKSSTTVVTGAAGNGPSAVLGLSLCSLLLALVA